MLVHTILVGALSVATLGAQQAPDNGPRPVDPGWHALIHAQAVPEAGQVIDDATIVIRDGTIVSIESAAPAPTGARVWDLSGLTVYPGLVEPHFPVEAPAPDPARVDTHWNPNVRSQVSALDGEGISEKAAEELRSLGFTVAALVPEGGIIRGSSAVVLLDEPRTNETRRVLSDGAFLEMSFARGRGGYPSSQMGQIALMRQTLMDARWDAELRRKTAESSQLRQPIPPRPALQALAGAGTVVFETNTELEALRAARIANEFGLNAALVGSGTEFRRLQAIAGIGMPIILPIDFPKAPDASTILERERISLRELMTWEQAPSNPNRLVKAGVTVALTTDRLEKRKDFYKNLRKALRSGLSKRRALAALTSIPAAMLGVEDIAGRIAPGYLANLTVTEGDLFSENGKILEVWIQGRRSVIEEPENLDLTGDWTAAMQIADLQIDSLVFASNKSVEIRSGDKKTKARKVEVARDRIDFVFDASDLGGKGKVAVNAVIEGEKMFGLGVDTQGGRFFWESSREGEVAETSSDNARAKTAESIDTAAQLPLPLGAYGRNGLPPQQDLVIRNATLWTAGPAGIIEGGTMVIEGGRISYVGTGEGAPEPSGATVLDAKGVHISPGLIDCHSHTGISSGINEGTQAVTSEVRIGDVIDPDAIGWYRQLAGGLTAANQLHGSANPIGGQNSVVKLRWGVSDPNDMRIDGAIGGIKFALGENVTRARSTRNTRYPDTRMGVEAIIRDRFLAAQDYRAEHQRYEALSLAEKSNTLPPRRDLELDALVEILEGDRLIHCHSYRQDEILMLSRVAQEFGFKIGTFQHVLEGYKVAEAIRESAIGASSFSDWWAYKFEVIDAVPENGAIMHQVGIPVSFNSDSNELARRMNTEAAKAVKYGGLDPNDALKFVTLNAAKQLKIDDRVGSLEVGKDADFVLWNGSPLSTFSRCLETWIDGRRYFSEEEDSELRTAAQAERERLIQVVLSLDESERRKGGAGNNRSSDNRPGECGCYEVFYEVIR